MKYVLPVLFVVGQLAAGIRKGAAYFSVTRRPRSFCGYGFFSTGKVRFNGWVCRAEKPGTSWWEVVLWYLGGI